MKRKAYKRKSPELSSAEIEARRKGGMARSRKKTRACRKNALLTAGVPRSRRKKTCPN